MDLFKKLREWIGIDKPSQPNFKAQEITRQRSASKAMPKVLSQQGQQDWMKKNTPLLMPKVAPPKVFKPPTLQMPQVGGVQPKNPTMQQPPANKPVQVKQQLAPVQKAPKVTFAKPTQQSVTLQKPSTVKPVGITTGMLSMPGQPKTPDVNRVRLDAEKDAKRMEGRKILDSRAPGASMVSTAKRGDAKSVALGNKTLNTLLQEFNNSDADGQRTIRKTLEKQRDFHSSAQSTMGRQLFQETNDALKVLDSVGEKKGPSLVTIGKDVGEFGKNLVTETVTAGKHIANPIAAPLLYERERTRLAKGEIDGDTFNRNVKRITDNSDSYWRLGYDKNGFATLLDPTKKDDGTKRGVLEGTLAFGQDVADAGVAVGTTVVPFAAPARIAGLGTKQTAIELAKEGAAYQAVDTANEMVQGRNPLDPEFLASSLIPNIGLPLASQGARALRTNTARPSEATPGLPDEPAIMQARVSREVPQTPAARAAAVEQGIITPETKNLSLSERVATAINHKTMSASPIGAEPAQLTPTQTPSAPEFSEAVVDDIEGAPYAAPEYIDSTNPSLMRQGPLDEIEAQPYYSNQEFNPEGMPVPTYRIDNIDQRVQEVVEFAQARGINDSRMLDDLRAQSRAFFGDEQVNMPEELRGTTDESLLGRFQDDEIDVRAGQSDPTRTYFHEALHRALAEYTTMPERRALYAEIRQKYGDEALLAEAQQNGYNRGLFEAIEEHMADDFMEFAANRSSGASLSTRAQAIFADILERIKSAFGRGDISSQFMRDLYEGRFANRVKNSDVDTSPSAAQLELDEQYQTLQERYDTTTDERMKGYINQALAANRTERRRVEQDPRYRRDEGAIDNDRQNDAEPLVDEPELSAEAINRTAAALDVEAPRQARMTEAEYDDMVNDAYRKSESANLEQGRTEAKDTFEALENNPVEQKRRNQEAQLRKVNEAIQRGFENGPRHTIEKIVDTTAELGFVPRKKVEEMVQKYANDNWYDISTGRAHKTVVEEVRSLADEDGLIKTVDEIQPSDKVLGRIRLPGVKHALPYNDPQPGDAARQMVYKNEDGTHGTFFEYKTPDGKWQKSGLEAVSVKSPQSGIKLEKLKSNAEVNAEAKRVYEDGTTAQYIWRENDAGVNSEFIREFDAAMGDASKLDKIDSNKIVGFDPDKHYIEAGKVVDASNGKILGNYIEITPEGVNMFAGRQRISLNYNELDLTKIREMKTNGITWTTEGIIDRITGNRKHTNGVDYFKSGGSKTKEALMSVMVEEPRAAQRNILDEDSALGAAINAWEKGFHKVVKRPKRADARRDAVYVIEPAAKRAEGEAKTTIEQRLEEFASSYGQKAADHLKDYDQFMRGVYDNLLVRMNKERLAIGQPEIKRRANYITHIAEMADGGILRQSIQGINNIIGGDVMVDSRGALPSSITGTTGNRKPKSKYSPFSSERLADNKPLNPFDPLRVYSNLALQNIHMTKPITMNRSIETTVRGLSEAKQEMSSSRGIEYVNELLDEVLDKSRNGKATPEDYTTLSRKLFGVTRVYQNIEGVQGFQRILRKAAKENDVIDPSQKIDVDTAATFENTATLIRDQLSKLANDVDSLNNLKKEADGLQQFVGIIQEHTNKLAGKTNWMIRGLKDLEKGKGTDLGLLIAKGFQQHAALTSIVGNASSTLAQLMATPLVMGTTRVKYQLEGLNLMNNKELMKKSDALWIRYKESTLAQKTKFQKTMNVGGLPLLTVERAVMKWTFGSKYAEAIGRGLDERQAIKYAERFIGDTTSWRDVASAPRAYDRPLPASLLQFTREVTQQYRGFWNRFTPAEKAKTLIAIAVVTNGLALITGNKSGADPIGAALETGWDVAGMNDADREEEENTAWAKALRAGQNALSEVVSAVPMASAAANTIWSKDDRTKIFGEDSTLGKYEGNMAMFTALGNFVRGGNNLMAGNPDQAWKDFVKTLPMGSQLQKSAAGLQAMFRGYTTTSTGKIKSSVDQSNAANWLLGGLFGVNAIPDNRKAVSENTAMSEKQSEWFKKLQADGQPDAAKKYAAALKADSKKQGDDEIAGKDSSDLSYDDDSLKKFVEGKWKQVDGMVVDEDGEIARDFYKGRAKTRKDENSDEVYKDFAIGYELEKTAEVSDTGNSTLDKMKNLENAKKANNKANTAVGLYGNSKEEYEDIPEWVKDAFYTKAGFTKKEVEYATGAGYSVDAKVDGYFRPLAEAGDRKKLVNELYAGRVKGINGKYFATSTVIEKLYDEGYLTKDERKALKKISLDKNGKDIASKNGGSGGGSGSKKEYTSADISKLVNSGSSTYSAMANILKATRAAADTSGSKKVASRSVKLRGLRAIVKSRKQSTKLRRLA